jgi:hypothetical protein
VGRVERNFPSAKNLFGIGRAEEVHVGEGSEQRSKAVYKSVGEVEEELCVRNGLVCRPVFTDSNGVVCSDTDESKALQSSHTYGGGSIQPELEVRRGNPTSVGLVCKAISREMARTE